MSQSHCSCCHENEPEHTHEHQHSGGIKEYLSIIFSFVLLMTGLLFDYIIKPDFFDGTFRLIYYVIAYIPVAFPVIKESFNELKKGSFFNEFSLMTIATLGAFFLKEYPEAVGVMLFYTVGELFQGMAVKKAKKNIKDLLSVRVDKATVLRDNQWKNINPKEVKIGETLQVKVGEKIPVDGELLSDIARLNTSAITGESKPMSVKKGEKVLSGSINLEKVIELKATSVYENSSLSRILKMVEEASHRKAKTELLIRRLAKVYTPIVFGLAVAICVIPLIFDANYDFYKWFYRALVFLVISCPCALVISIPLGYFGGLGASSRKGILLKGAMFLDQLTQIDTLVMDKTGTLTKGVFKIKEINSLSIFTESEIMTYLMALESKSTHPIAKAIMEYSQENELLHVDNVEEISGKGLKGEINGKRIYAGSQKLFTHFNIALPENVNNIVESVVFIGIDEQYAGYVTIADEIKSDAKESLEKLRHAGIKDFIMLSGDKNSITQKVAHELGIKKAIGNLLPEDKLNEVEKIQKNNTKVAFMGDGINDAPVLATAHIGIAMGAMGSDVAIETADIVIQTDEPSKLATAINIAKATQRIIWQNIFLALGIKALILTMGALGYANLWEAVFADVGVALLAVLNAVRLQRMEFN
ncbi:cadmium-translocating P-type ATPase [Weeksellaceae bacterium TAE3-ERU29]|nr:cadmium-translocating P-type ATPase [Weeksellaceae bacterium TAE3-ERU29]